LLPNFITQLLSMCFKIQVTVLQVQFVFTKSGHILQQKVAKNLGPKISKVEKFHCVMKLVQLS